MKRCYRALERSMIAVGEIASTDLSGTVLDHPDEMQVIPAIGDGPLGPVREILLPPMGMQEQDGFIILHRLQDAANTVLRTGDALIRAPEQLRARAAAYYKRCVSRYYDTLAFSISGKGSATNSLQSIRAAYSCTGHCGISYEINPCEVSIPGKAYKTFVHEWRKRGGNKITAKPWAIVFRHPCLHSESMRCLYIRKGDNHTIDVHPAVCPGMGADRDGDLLFCVLGWPDVQPTFEWTLRFDNEMLLNRKSEDIDRKNPIWDTRKRLEFGGVVLNPEDIINCRKSENIKKICEVKKLDVAEIAAYAHGRSKEELIVEDQGVANARILEKLGIGPMGVRAQRARAICLGRMDLQKSANYLTERGAQALFDSKHEYSSTYKTVLNVLNKSFSSSGEAISALRREGLDKRADKFVELLYSVKGSLAEINETLNPSTETARQSAGNVAVEAHRRTQLLGRKEFNPLVKKVMKGVINCDSGAAGVADQKDDTVENGRNSGGTHDHNPVDVQSVATVG